MPVTDRGRPATRVKQTVGPLSGIVFALSVLSVIALCALSFEISRDLASLRSTSSVSVNWSMSQLEVEYLRAQEAIAKAAEGDAPLSEVRRRFDIFFSRAHLIAESSVFAVLRSDPLNNASIFRITGWLGRVGKVIDGSDKALAAALPVLERSIASLSNPIRQLSLSGVRIFATKSDERRAAFSSLLFHTALIAIALVILLGFLLAILVLQNRASIRHAEKLRLSAERFEQTINGSINAVVVTDEDGRILEFNPSAERIFGRQRESSVGRNIEALLIPDRHRGPHIRGMAHFKQTGTGTIIGHDLVETEALHADGREFPVELALTHTTGPDGSHFVAYIRDITRRQAAERELIDARDKALAAARAKSEFLAVMSHEMRTPLNGVLAVLDLMEGTALDAKQREYLRTAITSGEILQHHIDGVLDITRMEAGRFSIKRKPFDLLGLLEEIARISRPLAEARANVIDLRPNLPEGLVMADRHRVGQILLNLVSNAVKFTEGGKIDICASAARAASDAKGTVSIAVFDTGIGIAQSDLERVFEDFVMLDSSFQRTAEGSGLGLSICRRLARAMGGEITLESTVGRGSCFTLRLPLEFVPQVKLPPPPEAAARSTWLLDRSLDVLLVEDNLTNRFAAREMLSRHGCTVTEAQDGLVGLGLSEQHRYDFILMDVSMPRMDGIESTRAIRSGDGASAQTPIIGLTAHQLSEMEDTLLGAGMNYCLNKPLRITALQALLERLFPEHANHADPSDPAHPAAGDHESLVAK